MPMTKFTALAALLLTPFFAVTAFAVEPEVEPDIDVVWSSSDGLKMEIFYAQRKDGVWLDPVQISDDHYDNMYPVIDRDSSGRRWIFWTAYDKNTMALHYRTGRDTDWQPVEKLQTDRQTNISPTLVVDSEDRVWVAWSANNGDLDDIMYAYSDEEGWSEPALVHEENETADMLPVIDIGQAGAPFVTWRAVKDGKHVTVLSRLEDGEFSDAKIQDVEAEDSDERESDVLELPPYVKNSSMIFLRMY